MELKLFLHPHGTRGAKWYSRSFMAGESPLVQKSARVLTIMGWYEQDTVHLRSTASLAWALLPVLSSERSLRFILVPVFMV